MVIDVFSKKGGEGKTAWTKFIADEIFGFILTNDDDILPSINNRGCKRMPLSDIAKLNFKDMPDTIIDMGGYIENGAVEIFKKSDLLILVIDGKSPSSMYRGISSLEEVLIYNENIMVIVAKTKSQRDFARVKKEIKDKNLKVKAIFESREHQLFNQSMRAGLSVREFLKSSKLARSHYETKSKNQKSDTIMEQLNKIINYIKEYK